MDGILIFAETDAGQLRSDFWELVAVGRQLLPRVGGRLQVAVTGAGAGTAAAAAALSGADQVLLAEDDRLAGPWPDAHLAVLTALCRQHRPALLLLPRSLLGMELSARLSVRLGAGVAQDAMSAAVDGGVLTATRPVFGGAAVAAIRLAGPPWIVVPRARAFAPAEPLARPAGAVVPVAPDLPAALPTRCGARVRQQGGAQDLERARVIVAGGRGLGGPEPFALLQEIAGLLGGAVAASRPPCDSGWVAPGLQVGLTGKTVAPDIYIAVGISGSSQHMAGCANARVIVAVNSDQGAPIFRNATYGVVGNWKEVLPAFRDALARQLGAPGGAGP